jgi:MinD-like ATPase involved in chromosome partitioning or flagellar assembly
VLESLVRSMQAAKKQNTKLESQTIAVTSPHGSTGKTTVAINMALELAAEKFTVLLIDADLEGPSVANYFCLAELPAGLAGSIRIASQHRFDQAQLERLSVQAPKTSLAILPGVISEQPLELTSEIVKDILETAKASFDFVVLDLGPLKPNPNKDAFDLTREIVSIANQVVLVAAADPIGIYRLLRLEPTILAITESPKLVINRLRNSVIAQAKSEIKTTLAGLGTIEVAAFLPDDPVHVDQATRLGMSGGGRSGSFRSAVGIFTKASILGRQGALDARVAKLG